MNSRERVIRAITFDSPDRVPTDLWLLPAAVARYGDALEALRAKYPTDIASVNAPFELSFDPRHYEIGEFVDDWGSGWRMLQAGVIGEVKTPALRELSDINAYEPPFELFRSMWGRHNGDLKDKIAAARAGGKFVIGGWISVFERMQFLRGSENFYCDLAEGGPDLDKLRAMILDFYDLYLDRWLEEDVDAVAFGDDWGSQRSPLISKEMWIGKFKPLYKHLMDRIRAAGKYVFFHSDGWIFELYDQLIELGVSAVNSQLWCMGVDKVADAFAGRIAFWGEVSRQDTLPTGTPDDVERCKSLMVEKLFVNGGGLIGEGEANRDVPLENIEALLKPWVRRG